MVTAGADHIAPPQGTKPLLDLVASEDITCIDRPGGHIGLMAGSKAREEIWPDIAQWLSRAFAKLKEERVKMATETDTREAPSSVRRREAEGTRRAGHRRHARDRSGDLPQPRQPGRDDRRWLQPRPGAGRESFQHELEQMGVESSIHQGNVASAEDCKRTVGEVIDRHGRLDILINNAGITSDRPIMKMAEDDWYTVLAVNLSGAFFMSQAALEHMLERGSGRIVNISSIVGQIGNIGQTNYAASKSGLFGLTMTLAREAAFNLKKRDKLEPSGLGLTVNAVAPGFIETEMLDSDPREGARPDPRADPAGPPGPPGRGRSRGALPVRRRLVLHHRPGVGGQRRPGDVAQASRGGRGLPGRAGAGQGAAATARPVG